MSKLAKGFPVFTDRLNQLLRESGKPAIKFADDLGVSRQSLGYWLKGERVPDLVPFKGICERCNVSADWLLGLSDVRQADPKYDNPRAVHDGIQEIIKHLVNM